MKRIVEHSLQRCIETVWEGRKNRFSVNGETSARLKFKNCAIHVVYIFRKRHLFIGCESFSADKKTFSVDRKSFLTGNKSFLTGNESFPTGNKSFPTGNENFPTGNKSFPTGNESFPTGKEGFPTGNKSFPTGGKMASEEERYIFNKTETDINQ
ncbi:MAG: hypothetical protein LBD27_05595 [Tannerella sp.]|jgi:hypothetical protein|nr:hypothetical protein [Tannerella sp.]